MVIKYLLFTIINSGGPQRRSRDNRALYETWGEVSDWSENWRHGCCGKAGKVARSGKKNKKIGCQIKVNINGTLMSETKKILINCYSFGN